MVAAGGGTRRICLITPGHLSTNPRLVKEARALSEAGYDVQIIHGRYLPWGVEQDKLLASPVWKLIPVRFGRREAPFSVHLRQRLIQIISSKAYQFGVNLNKVAIAAHSPAALDLIKATRQAPRADLYIGHYPSGLAAAAIAAAEHNSKYAFDAEDFHLGDLPDVPTHDTKRSIIRRIENDYVHGSAYVTAAAPLIADAYVDAYNISRPTPILNVFPKSNAPSSPTSKGSTAPGPSLYWFSQTIGPGRGLETAIRGIALAKTKPHLYLRGAISSLYKRQLEEIAAEFDARKRLHILPPSPPDDMERIASTYDVGLAGEIADTRNHKFALANKIFSYISAGIPCLASNIPSHINFNHDNPGLLTIFRINDHFDLAEKFDTIINSPNYESNRRDIWYSGQSTINWDREKHKLLDLIHCSINLKINHVRPCFREQSACSDPATRRA
jgi:hypothetical protein